jgi:hypothetical protein
MSSVVGDDVWGRQEGLTGSSNLHSWQCLGARGAAGVWVSLCNNQGGCVYDFSLRGSICALGNQGFFASLAAGWWLGSAAVFFPIICLWASALAKVGHEARLVPPTSVPSANLMCFAMIQGCITRVTVHKKCV